MFPRNAAIIFQKSFSPSFPQGREQSEHHSLLMVASSGTQNEKDILSDNSVTLGLEYGKCHDLKVSLCYVFVISLSLTSVFFNLCLFGECHITRMLALHSGIPAFSSWARKKRVNKLIKEISEIFREGITSRERTWMPLRELLQNVCVCVCAQHLSVKATPCVEVLTACTDVVMK